MLYLNQQQATEKKVNSNHIALRKTFEMLCILFNVFRTMVINTEQTNFEVSVA